MDEVWIQLLFFAAIAAFTVIKKLLRDRESEAPPPPAPDQAEGRAPSEPEGERIDLSFLQGAFESLGVELPEELEAADDYTEYAEDAEDTDEFDPPEAPPTPEPDPHPGHDSHPRRLAAAAYESAPVPHAPRDRDEFVTAEEISPFFADLDDYWDHETQSKRSGKADLIVDAVILGAMFTPYKRH